MSWENYDDVMSQLRDAGLIIDKPLSFDARIQRWKVENEDREKRGWSRLREWNSDSGKTYIVGVYGVWHGNDDGKQKITLSKSQDDVLTAAERAAMREAHKEAERKLAEVRKAETKRAAQWAASVWERCMPCAEHDYLTLKQIKPHGLRILPALDELHLEGVDDSNFYRLKTAAGALVVPMHEAKGNIQGLQFIYAKGHPRRTKIERDKEFWPTGMAMGGTFGLIGPVRRTGILLIAEGYATAASLHEATGQSVAYAFSANNLIKAGKQLAKEYPSLRLLFCADDDYLTEGNPGCKAAAEACAAIENTAWIKPEFPTDADGNDIRAGKKLTDFNDLHILTGLPLVLADQVNAKLDEMQWRDAPARAGVKPQGGGERGAMPSILSVDEAVSRYWGTYGLGGKVLFDSVEHRLVHRDDVMNLLADRAWNDIKRHPDWRVARDTEIGFDPTECDAQIRCNLFSGWPTVPKQGSCDALLGLLEYLCANDGNGREVFQWALKWLAYPLQHRGAKMQSTIVVHGPQGTGKSRFFEAYAEIFGEYARVLGQEALEDKFNSDWSEKKLFILADEVLARQDMYHIKNRLKGFITGGTIRVNPKGVAAHNEKNQMNIVFLSNERQPLVLENDDRRHLVIWVPPKLSDEFFADVNSEIENGGVAALHHYLLNLDLGDFKPWTKPPMTKAKAELIENSLSSEERFVNEWMRGEIEGEEGAPLPFCPCLGSHLYRVYERWCEQTGERKRAIKDLISLCGKRNGWSAGVPCSTWTTLVDRTIKSRKMIVPPESDIAVAGSRRVLRDEFDSKSHWLTACFFEFANAAGFSE